MGTFLGKFFRFLLILLAVLAAVFYAGGQFLPDRASASRSIEISASPAEIWPLVADLNRFNDWSPWAQRDPEMEITVSGAPMTVDHAMTWRSEMQGDGTLTIVETNAPNLLRTGLDFGPQGTATARFDIAANGAGSMVTWSFESELDGPVQRWFGLILPGMIGADYEEGLVNLKALAEG